jgi:biotin carboxyl carrier protein
MRFAEILSQRTRNTMKFNIKIQSGSQGSDHQLELQPGESLADSRTGLKVRLDGGDNEDADCVEIRPGVYSIILAGRSYEARVSGGASGFSSGSGQYTVISGAQEYIVEIQDLRSRRSRGTAGTQDGPQDILAPMPGKIVKVLVKENEEVAAGHGLVVIEAMKMQNELRAPRPGRVGSIYVSAGTGVETGAKLVRLV